MFNGIHFLTKPKKNIQDELFKKYLYDSINKHNKLSIYIDEDNKKKQNYQNIISKNNTLIKTTNHSVNDLINKSKYNNFIFLVSFMSLSIFIIYKIR